MPSKELKFTKGYNQEELNAWWKARGLPGEPLTIPDWLVGKQIGNGRDAYGIYDIANGKKRQSYKDINKAYGADASKIANDFRNNLGKFTDRYREQSGISKIAGGVLNAVGTAVGGPVWGLMTTVADAGNKALHPDESSSSDFGEYGAIGGALGSIYSGLGGPGSYGAAHPSGTPDKSGSNLRTASRIVGALSAATAKPGSSIPTTPSSADNTSTAALPSGALSRRQTPYTGDYTKYGLGPEHSFFGPGEAPNPATATVPVGVAPPPRVSTGLAGLIADRIRGIQPVNQGDTAMAEGGALKHYPLRPKGQPSQELRNFANLPGMDDPRVRIAMGDRKTPTQFVSHGTGAGGRDDNIDAKLSENEYVIDAETVSLLGDGSPEAGAKKLDAMREGIRRHKGQALAKGKISPDAHPGALHYLADGRKFAEGGKVTGALRALFKRKPPVDPNAGLRRIKAQLDAALVRAPVAPPRRATAEELNQDVLDLRREVGPQGGDTRPLGRKYADGGAVRPRQTLTQAMDEADTAFDKWKSLPRMARKGSTSDYEKRQRARVGDTTYDLDPPQRVARNNRGGK